MNSLHPISTVAIGLGVLSLALCSCSESANPSEGQAGSPQAAARVNPQATGGKMDYRKKSWGKVDGKPVLIYYMTNGNGMRADISNYGAIVRCLEVPDRNGKIDDIVLGYASVNEYLEDSPYFGALVGRYGNRIARGRFTLDGEDYKLAVNNGPNHLHGGLKGFDKVIWDAEPYMDENGVSLKLTYMSKDGEEGYPGNLKLTAIYTLTKDNELKIDYEATTDKPTVLNVTHHGYFNLAGQGKSDILNHELMINAARFTPVDETLITTGELRPVKGTPFDFTSPRKIGERIDQSDDEQIRFGKGYDHNFVLNKSGKELTPAARVEEPTSGRVMEVYTTEPGVQFYAGNFLDGSNVGKDGKVYKHRYGFCLETQHFPDSPNKQDNKDFPSVVLRPGEKFTSQTFYRFSTTK
jgi:aldose 1-epimerase